LRLCTDPVGGRWRLVGSALPFGGLRLPRLQSLGRAKLRRGEDGGAAKLSGWVSGLP